MNTKVSLFALAALLLNVASGFAPMNPCAGTASKAVVSSSSTQLQMASDDDLLRWARSSRNADADDNLVELVRPVGVVLAEDDKGNVFVETVAPNGNAARSGKVSQDQFILSYTPIYN